MDGGADIEKAWETTRRIAARDGFSVVMPFYNLADAAEANIKAVSKLFSSHGVPATIVPVDDGSTDGTAEAMARAAEAVAKAGGGVRVTPVYCPRNAGKGAALKRGFAASSGAAVLLLDGDLDIDPARTPEFFAAMEKSGADIVLGSKRHPLSSVEYPWHRRLASAAYHTLVKMLLGFSATDTQTGMKLFRRDVLGDALSRMLVKAYAFDLEILAIATGRGAKIAEAPVTIRFGNKIGALRPAVVKSMLQDTLAVFYRSRILRYYDKIELPPPLAEPPRVSVVVACPGAGKMLEECVSAVKAQTWPDVETIILPDAFDAAFAENPVYAGVRVEPTGKTRPAEKRNRGISLATGRVVAFIDDDAYPEPSWIESAVKYFSDPSIGAVGGPAVTPPGDGFLESAGGRVYANPLVSGNYRYRYCAGGTRRDVDDYPSCNLLVRKDLLESFGGYRLDFWPGEDTLLCKDIVDRGFRIVYDPWVVVFHHRRALFGPHLRQLGRYAFHRGYFAKRFPSNSLRFSYFVPTAFVAYLAMLAAAGCACALVHSRALASALALFAIPGGIYGALVLAGSFSFNPAKWALTAAGVVASHAWYGVKFALGLCAKKAPCEFIGKDRAK